jgi:hypothetical protein
MPPARIAATSFFAGARRMSPGAMPTLSRSAARPFAQAGSDAG